MREKLQRLNWPNVLIVFFVLLIVIGAYLAFRKDPDQPADKPSISSSQQDTSKKSNDSQNSKKTDQSTGSDTTNKKPTTTPAAPVPSTPTAAQSGQLANSGPGETIAIFSATALVGTTAYHLVQRRRVA